MKRPADLKPGESVARCFYFSCDSCGWRTDRWSWVCHECGHHGCTRTDVKPELGQTEMFEASP